MADIRNVGRTYEEQLRQESELAWSMFQRKDSKGDGAKAFRERRKPDWRHHGLRIYI